MQCMLGLSHVTAAAAALEAWSEVLTVIIADKVNIPRLWTWHCGARAKT